MGASWHHQVALLLIHTSTRLDCLGFEMVGWAGLEPAMSRFKRPEPILLSFQPNIKRRYESYFPESQGRILDQHTPVSRPSGGVESWLHKPSLMTNQNLEHFI